MQISM